MDTLSGEVTLPLFASLLNGIQVLDERIYCGRNKLFAFRVDHFWKGLSPREANRKFQKFYPLTKMAENVKVYLFALTEVQIKGDLRKIQG